eukprot:g52846.t1
MRQDLAIARNPAFCDAPFDWCKCKLCERCEESIDSDSDDFGNFHRECRSDEDKEENDGSDSTGAYHPLLPTHLNLLPTRLNLLLPLLDLIPSQSSTSSSQSSTSSCRPSTSSSPRSSPSFSRFSSSSPSVQTSPSPPRSGNAASLAALRCATPNSAGATPSHAQSGAAAEHSSSSSNSRKKECLLISLNDPRASKRQRGLSAEATAELTPAEIRERRSRLFSKQPKKRLTFLGKCEFVTTTKSPGVIKRKGIHGGRALQRLGYRQEQRVSLRRQLGH